MRIAFVAQPIDPVLPPHQNSIGLIIHHTACRLAAEHDVTIFVNARHNDPANVPDDGITYRFVSDWPDTPVLDFLGRFPNRFPQSAIVASDHYYRGYAGRVAGGLARGNYDWVHVLNFSQFMPLFKRRAPRSRFALEMQCEWLTQFPPAAVRRRVQDVDLITGSSGYIARLIRDRYPEIADRCHTLYNGYDDERFSPGEPRGDARPTRIVFVGRVSPEKGIHTLLDAMERVVAERPDAHLDLVGPLGALPLAYIVGISEDPKVQALAAYYDGQVCTDYEAYLRERAGRSPLAGHVTFVGGVPQAELCDWYRRSDVLANPSFSESFGMSLVEGMATGLPAVATRIGGMPEIVVPGETGHLRESGDAAGLAADLLDCLQSAARRDELGAAGLRRAREVFTWEARARTLADLFS
ncbi:glycosyltransferase family 4 protein [bacterium]|nr:glycosyltransferase family 4 protein [bacterium]